MPALRQLLRGIPGGRSPERGHWARQCWEGRADTSFLIAAQSVAATCERSSRAACLSSLLARFGRGLRPHYSQTPAARLAFCTWGQDENLRGGHERSERTKVEASARRSPLPSPRAVQEASDPVVAHEELVAHQQDHGRSRDEKRELHDRRQVHVAQQRLLILIGRSILVGGPEGRGSSRDRAIPGSAGAAGGVGVRPRTSPAGVSGVRGRRRAILGKPPRTHRAEPGHRKAKAGPAHEQQQQVLDADESRCPRPTTPQNGNVIPA